MLEPIAKIKKRKQTWKQNQAIIVQLICNPFIFSIQNVLLQICFYFVWYIFGFFLICDDVPWQKNFVCTQTLMTSSPFIPGYKINDQTVLNEHQENEEYASH